MLARHQPHLIPLHLGRDVMPLAALPLLPRLLSAPARQPRVYMMLLSLCALRDVVKVLKWDGLGNSPEREKRKSVNESGNFKQYLEGQQKSGGRRGSVLETLLNKHDAELESRLKLAGGSTRRNSLEPPRQRSDSDDKSSLGSGRRASLSVTIERRQSSSGALGLDRVRRTSSESLLNGAGRPGDKSPTIHDAKVDPLSTGPGQETGASLPLRLWRS